MKRASLVVLVVCAMAAPAGRARAFVRSKGEASPYPCLWWAQPSGVPVVANVTSGPGAGGCATANDVEALVQSSLATWGAAKSTSSSASCTSFRFQYAGRTISQAVGYDQRSASNDNIILFRHGLCDGNPACGSDLEACADQIGCWPHATRANISTARTIAITTTSYIPSTGEIVDADMELFDRPSSSDPAGYYFTCSDNVANYCSGSASQPITASCVSTDLGSIVTHEAGHMLGLDHSPVPTSTMYQTYTPGSIKLRDLDQDDISGVCTVYPAGGGPLMACSASTVPPPVQEQPKSSGGCSTAGGGVISMIGAALALMRSSRRSRARQDTTTPA